MPTDVSDSRQVNIFVCRTVETFGTVHLLFNIAEVGSGIATPLWESPVADWQWLMGVNLWGVIHGMRAFVPAMIAQDVPCPVVNVASVAGLTSGTRLGIYRMTKRAVVSLSEDFVQPVV